MADLSPLERAGRVRAVASYWEADELMGLVPPGSLIFRDEAEMLAYLREKGFVPLTPDDVGALLGLIKGAQLDDAHPNMDEALALLAGKGQTEERITHGRHCACSACSREDWTRITGSCGMHGKDCPNVYAPLGLAGKGQT